MLSDNLFNLGTAPTGADGDTARAAGEKYNLHEHPGTVCLTLNDFELWLDGARKLGDICLFNGIPRIWDGDEAVPIGLGVVAPGAALDTEIILALKQMTSGAGEDLIAIDYFDPTTYNIPRINKTVHLKLVLEVLSENSVIEGHNQQETTITLLDKTSNEERFSFAFTKPDPPEGQAAAPAILYISDPLDLIDSNICYTLNAVNVGDGCMIYKAAFLIRYSVEDDQ